MKRVQTTITAIALALGSSVASASTWTAGITYDGTLDTVQDNSVSLALTDAGVVGTVDPGDVIAGIIKWNVNTGPGGGPFGNHAIAVFATTVTAANGALGNSFGGDPLLNFSLGAATPTLNALLPGLSGSVGGFTPGTLGVVLSSVGGTDPTTLALGASLGTIDATYALDLEFGFAAATDFFEAELRDHRIAGGGLGADGVISITDGDADGYIDEYDDAPAGAGPGGFISSAITGFESGGFSIFRDFSAGATYLPLSTTRLSGAAAPGTFDIVLAPSTTLVQPTANQVANGYSFADQSIAQLNPLPEPNMVALFGLGLAGLGFSMRRRKAKTA